MEAESKAQRLMPADDVLGLQFQYSTPEYGESYKTHAIEALNEGAPIGKMEWSGRHGIRKIDVEPEFARRGVATAMWNEAHRLAEQNARIPKPKHSPQRTEMGDAWARAVGGRLPRRSRPG